MSTLTKVLVGVGSVGVLLALIGLFSVIGINNDCIQQESGLTQTYKNNQNKYDAFVKTVAEMAQVPAMYRDDLKTVTLAAISGRYGKGGSKAVFQFIKEHNPSFDSALYVKLQQAIESGRISFAADQTTLLDKKRVYENTLKIFPTGAVARLLGFPKLDLSKIDIVTSEETEKVFSSKKSAPLKLR